MRHGDYAYPKFYIEIISNSIYTYLKFSFLETSTSNFRSVVLQVKVSNLVLQLERWQHA